MSIIDDFTKIHTNRRPDFQMSNAMSMCTIVVKAFNSLKAIRVPKDIWRIHHPDGVNVEACVNAITSAQQLTLLSNSYASSMPSWLTSLYFSPELQRHILEEHTYCDDSDVRRMRTMEDLHHIDFVELQLKSKDDFSKAHDVVMSSGFETYMKQFLVIQPGDWPAQFFCRQLVYQSLHQQSNAHKVSQESSPSFSVVNENLPPVTSLIPTMGPLHISLNSRKHVFETFKPFFKTIYGYLFSNSKLAEKPKPWRINLLLETVYGGWILIRAQVIEKFKSSKDIQYGVLLNLLDNYLPLVLTVYTVIFERNNFAEYMNAMIRIWVMFLCLQRRHYNKAPLVWLSNTWHWKGKHQELYE